MSEVIIIIILLIIALLIIFTKTINTNKKYIHSDIDNKQYLVLNKQHNQKAANMLARINININKITTYIIKQKNDKYKDYKKYINQLSRNIKHIKLQEGGNNDKYTSYSINKGEQIVFCLRSKQNDKLHDINLVMYVMLHELSHVACPEYGHTPLFKKIFAFLTNIAIEMKLYKKLEFNKDPIEYCGLMITDSIV